MNQGGNHTAELMSFFCSLSLMVATSRQLGRCSSSPGLCDHLNLAVSASNPSWNPETKLPFYNYLFGSLQHTQVGSLMSAPQPYFYEHKNKNQYDPWN